MKPTGAMKKYWGILAALLSLCALTSLGPLLPAAPQGVQVVYYPPGKKALKQYEGCLKKSSNKQSSCLTQLAQKLQLDLASKKDWPSYKRELVIVALLINDRLGQHEDYDKLRARLIAYDGAMSIEKSLGGHSLSDYFWAMYQYFQRLGAEYKPDADWALRGYGRESGNGGTNWASVMTQALESYNRGVADGQQATAQALAVAKANQEQEQRQREQAYENAVAQLQPPNSAANASQTRGSIASEPNSPAGAEAIRDTAPKYGGPYAFQCISVTERNGFALITNVCTFPVMCVGAVSFDGKPSPKLSSIGGPTFVETLYPGDSPASIADCGTTGGCNYVFTYVATPQRNWDPALDMYGETRQIRGRVNPLPSSPGPRVK